MELSKYALISTGSELLNSMAVVESADELIMDLISLITSFCARVYGNRGSSRKTELLIAELQNYNDK
jgi:predicted site-specific integrase-resolvase